MPEAQTSARPGRGAQIAILLALVLATGWCSTKAVIRAHVDGVIQGVAGRALPPFRLRDRAGAEWSPAALAGRPALLHFFRSRCENCEHEAPEFRRLEALLPAGRVTILHLLTDAVLEFPAAETEATIARKQFARPVLLADAPLLDSLHSVGWSNVTPITYVVDAQGQIRQGLRGAQTVASLQAALDRAGAQ